MQNDCRTLILEYIEEHFQRSVIVTDEKWNILWYNWFFALKVRDYVQGQPLKKFLEPIEKYQHVDEHVVSTKLKFKFTSLTRQEIMYCTIFSKNEYYVLFEEAYPHEDTTIVETMCKLTCDMADQIRSLSNNNRLLTNSNKKIQDIVYIDDLTKVFNRRYINEKISYFIKLAKEKHKAFSLLLIDIDYFKKVNDQYGHLVGDLVLANVAQHIQSNIRYHDVVGRFGGEEFIVIIPDYDANRTMDIAERLRNDIDHMHIRGYNVHVTISIGITHYMYDNDNIDTLVKRADEAMYQAKSSGRNCVKLNCPGTLQQA